MLPMKHSPNTKIQLEVKKNKLKAQIQQKHFKMFKPD